MTKDWDNLFYTFDKASALGSGVFSLKGADEYHFDLLCEKDFLRAYRECSPLKSIVVKRADLSNTGKYDVYNKNTDKLAQSTYEATSLRNILRKPNPLQTEEQFRAQQNIYIDIFGYCPVFKVPIAGQEGAYSAIWNIPPWLFDITYTRKWLMQTKIEGIYQQYFMLWNGENIKLDMKNVFFVLDTGIGTEYDTNLTIPDSRLVGNEYPVCNIIAAYKGRNTLITKRGAIGILTNELEDTAGAVPVDPAVKEQLQKDFKSYGIVGQAYQIIITDAKVKWQQMGFATKDLLLFEEIEDDVNRLCDAYEFAPELLARTENVTYDNKKEARKGQYRDVTIPQASSRSQQLTAGLVAANSTLEIRATWDHIEILAEDKSFLATVRLTNNEAYEIEYLNGLITKNEWRERLGEDRVNDPSFDEYYTAPAPVAGTTNITTKIKK